MTQVCLLSAPTETDLEDQSVLSGDASIRKPRDYPLGILALAAVLEDNGSAPQVVDLNSWYVDFLVSEEKKSGLSYGCYAAARLAELDYPIVGFGTICSSYPLTVLMAKQLKALRPDTVVLFGGPQASVVDEATMQHFPFVDFILRGEADCTLPSLIYALENGLSFDTVSSLTYRRRSRIVRNPEASLISDLDSLPLPAFHLYPGMTNSCILPLEHGRGCPFSCSFCSTNDFFRRRFRLKSPGRVMHEMDLLGEKYGVEYFDLMHDMFTVDRKKVVEFCEAVLGSGRSYRWGCSARTDCVDEELLELMAKAGCVSIFYGVESGSRRMQTVIDKRLDIDEAMRNVRSSCRLGMKAVASMIIGYPEEKRDDLSATFAFIGESMRNGKLEPHLHLLAPLAGTPLYNRYREELILEDIYTDISHNRLSQDVAERRLVTEYPDVFANFYSLPTPHLDRRYLQELREFFVRTMSRFRWLLVAWHDRGADLITLFDEWKQWSEHYTLPRALADLRRYYCSWEFDRHFIEFLSSRPAAGRSAYEGVLLGFEQELIRALGSEGVDAAGHNSAPKTVPLKIVRSDMRVVLERGVYLLHLQGDMKRVVDLLQRGEASDDSIHRPTKVVVQTLEDSDEVEVIETTHAVAEFLDFCDGEACVDEVLTGFAAAFGDFEGIAAWDVAVHGLRMLYKRKLIRLLPNDLFSAKGANGCPMRSRDVLAF